MDTQNPQSDGRSPFYVRFTQLHPIRSLVFTAWLWASSLMFLLVTGYAIFDRPARSSGDLVFVSSFSGIFMALFQFLVVRRRIKSAATKE